MDRTSSTIAVVSLAVALAACAAGTEESTADGSEKATSPASVSPTTVPPQRSPIDGEYRMTLTRRDVLAAGLPGSVAGEIAGVWRVTFSFEYAQQFVTLGGANITSDGYQGEFSVDGDQLTLTQGPPLVFDWRLADRLLALRLAVDGTADPVDTLIWTSHPWEWVGN